MKPDRYAFLLTLLVCAVAALGQTTSPDPHVSYLYPAGGRQGSVVKIVAGGQFLQGASSAYVSGDGVTAKVIRYVKPFRIFNRDQRMLLIKRIKEVRDRRLSELGVELPQARNSRLAPKASSATASGKTNAARNGDDKKKSQEPEMKLPDHPLLDDLENKSLRELAHLSDILFFPRQKQQMNRQLAEMVVFELHIDPAAEPGIRELRLNTRFGLTNPINVQIGQVDEVTELEPNDRDAYPLLDKVLQAKNIPLLGKPLELPVTLNGQIFPGDVDRFRFRAAAEQSLVIETHARSLIPYLADAVPGWFQATVALYDADGREVAFADDYRFHPDPVLHLRIPADGEYELEIRDAIYRGREDFVYRVTIDEKPFVTHIFPLGGRAGTATTASLGGWNIDQTQLRLDTQTEEGMIHQAVCRTGGKVSNEILYTIDSLPEYREHEANDTLAAAEAVTLPAVINGRIADPGDVDVFKFIGKADETIVIEVEGRCLNSPLDSLVRLTDTSGNVSAWNDDYIEMGENFLHKDISGLITHHADSRLMATLPRKGVYCVHLSDTQNHGGEAYAYRLRISPPMPDFALRVTPSSLNARAGEIIPVCMHVLRQDGFEGEIEVHLHDAPPGFELRGNRIPPGCDRICMTLTAPPKGFSQPVNLNFVGQAKTDRGIIKRSAVPADDVMQAFLYRHLVPAQELLISVMKMKWPYPPVELAASGPVQVSGGSSAMVRMKTWKRPILEEMKLELKDPPAGVSLHDVAVIPEGFSFRVQADKELAPLGHAGNLIVEAYREYFPRDKDGKLSTQKRRVPMGCLPAIPVEISK